MTQCAKYSDNGNRKHLIYSRDDDSLFAHSIRLNWISENGALLRPKILSRSGVEFAKLLVSICPYSQDFADRARACEEYLTIIVAKSERTNFSYRRFLPRGKRRQAFVLCVGATRDGFDLPTLEIMDIARTDRIVRTAYCHNCTNLASQFH